MSARGTVATAGVENRERGTATAEAAGAVESNRD